ncbi:MAG: hypothetical protein BGN98_10435 [Microbacterium sp. 69-7]|nr:MAG: hypothetical protein BGN98_10435 [Microbacterium sp. 69-7]
MSKSTRKARAAAAIPGSVAADPTITIEDAPALDVAYSADTKNLESSDWLIDANSVFTVDELAEFPLVIQKTKVGTRVRIWRDARGTWFREAGLLRIQRHGENDRRSYVITLFKGATQADLERLLDYVHAARRGACGRIWQRLEADWADDKTLNVRFRSFQYGDPYTNRDDSPVVIVCDEPRCLEKWHAGVGDTHVLDATEDRGKRIDYKVSVRKEVDDRDELGWYVDLYVPEFFGRPEEVASLMVDLQWMQEACRRANQPNPEPTADEALTEVTA